MHRLIAAFMLGALLTLPSVAQKEPPPKESAPDVPDAIAIPSGLEPVLFARVKGTLNYICEAGPDGKYEWTPKSVDAELRDRKDKVIGQHTTGPTWKLKDGSEVTAKPVAHIDSLDPDSVPWLLLDVINNSKKGVLANVTKIQSVHTHGGKPSNDQVCDESHKGTESKSNASADDYFFAPVK